MTLDPKILKPGDEVLSGGETWLYVGKGRRGRHVFDDDDDLFAYRAPGALACITHLDGTPIDWETS